MATRQKDKIIAQNSGEQTQWQQRKFACVIFYYLFPDLIYLYLFILQRGKICTFYIIMWSRFRLHLKSNRQRNRDPFLPTALWFFYLLINKLDRSFRSLQSYINSIIKQDKLQMCNKGYITSLTNFQNLLTDQVYWSRVESRNSITPVLLPTLIFNFYYFV